MRTRWLVKIKLLNQEERISVAEISIMNRREALAEIERLLNTKPLRYRILQQRNRTYYRDGAYTIKLRWFDSSDTVFPPVAEISSWLDISFRMVRLINRRDEQEI